MECINPRSERWQAPNTLGLPHRRKLKPEGERADGQGMSNNLVAQRLASSREGVVRRGTVGSPRHCEVLPDHQPLPNQLACATGFVPQGERAQGHHGTYGPHGPASQPNAQSPVPGTHLQVTERG